MDLKEIKVPKQMVCPACSGKITNASAVRGGAQREFSKNMIVLCCSCTQPLIVGDSGFRILTPADVAKLSKPTQSALLSTRMVLQRILSKNPKAAPN